LLLVSSRKLSSISIADVRLLGKYVAVLFAATLACGLIEMALLEVIAPGSLVPAAGSSRGAIERALVSGVFVWALSLLFQGLGVVVTVLLLSLTSRVVRVSAPSIVAALATGFLAAVASWSALAIATPGSDPLGKLSGPTAYLLPGWAFATLLIVLAERGRAG
jgi:hypothetical protein